MPHIFKIIPFFTKKERNNFNKKHFFYKKYRFQTVISLKIKNIFLAFI